MEMEQDDAGANLLLAAQEGDLDSVRGIIAQEGGRARALIDAAITEEGWRALDLACERGHGEVVAALLEQGASPQLVGPNGFTPLMWASRGGHLQIAQRLINDRRVDVNAAHASGATALAMACVQGHVDIVRALHESGAALDCATHRHKWTPLHLATLYGQVDVVRLLLALGNSPEVAPPNQPSK
ncbi:ankyrin repeat-containing domain protein [Pavlovales sp. CCMP2436]|nr:ankyrin repeat-containing domain protein [Pavlovales sp. CCMP2436]